MSGNQTWLVTGAGGFIGRRVVEQLAADPRVERLIAIDHRWDDRAELERQVGDGVVDRAVHLGWYADPTDYLTSVDANNDSLERSLELVDVLVSRSCRHLSVAGSCAEYAPSDEPLAEDAAIGPWSAYGRAKVALHRELDAVAPATGLDVAWCRVFHVSGPGESLRRVLPWVASELLAGREVALSDGTQVRDYLDVDDVAAAFVAVAAAGLNETVNICSGHGVEMAQLFGLIGELTGRADLLGFGQRPRAAHDAPRVVGTNDLLRAATPWSPRWSIREMIGRVVHDVRNRPAEGPL